MRRLLVKRIAKWSLVSSLHFFFFNSSIGIELGDTEEGGWRRGAVNCDLT